MDKNAQKQNNIEIIYKDKYILVINKPSGLVVHKGNGVKEKYTLVDWLLENKLINGVRSRNPRRKASLATGRGKFGMTDRGGDWKEKNRAGIVHRLDKDTSGLMIIAKNPKVGEILKKQFKNREVKKFYKTLVWGNISKEKDTIISSIGRKPSDSKRRTTGRGKIAITKYKVIKKIKINKYDFTYLNVEIKTGRTHQIRVHLKSIGHPLVGDNLYTKGKLNKISFKFGINRLFLHSYKIKFTHPKTGKKVLFKSNLSENLLKVINEN